MTNVQQILSNLHEHIKTDNIDHLKPLITTDLSKSLSWIKIGRKLLHAALQFDSQNLIKFLSNQYPQLLSNTEHGNNLILLELASKCLNTKMVEMILANRLDLETRESQMKFLDLTARFYIIEKKIFKVHPGLIPLNKKENKKLIKLLLEYEYNYFNTHEVTLHVDDSNIAITASIKENADVNKVNRKNQTLWEIISEEMEVLFEDPLFEDSTEKLNLFEEIYAEIFSCLIRNFVKLVSDNRDISNKNMAIVNKDYFKDYKKVCEEEITLMRDKIIEGTTISVYNLLDVKMERLVKFTNNFVIREFVAAREFSEAFPRYCGDILRRFENANFRRKLLDDAKIVLRSIRMGMFRLSDDCIMEIIGYLENCELRNLIIAFKG